MRKLFFLSFIGVLAYSLFNKTELIKNNTKPVSKESELRSVDKDKKKNKSYFAGGVEKKELEKVKTRIPASLVTELKSYYNDQINCYTNDECNKEDEPIVKIERIGSDIGAMWGKSVALYQQFTENEKQDFFKLTKVMSEYPSQELKISIYKKLLHLPKIKSMEENAFNDFKGTHSPSLSASSLKYLAKGLSENKKNSYAKEINYILRTGPLSLMDQLAVSATDYFTCDNIETFVETQLDLEKSILSKPTSVVLGKEINIYKDKNCNK